MQQASETALHILGWIQTQVNSYLPKELGISNSVRSIFIFYMGATEPIIVPNRRRDIVVRHAVFTLGLLPRPIFNHKIIFEYLLISQELQKLRVSTNRLEGVRLTLGCTQLTAHRPDPLGKPRCRLWYSPVPGDLTALARQNPTNRRCPTMLDVESFVSFESCVPRVVFQEPNNEVSDTCHLQYFLGYWKPSLNHSTCIVLVGTRHFWETGSDLLGLKPPNIVES